MSQSASGQITRRQEREIYFKTANELEVETLTTTTRRPKNDRWPRLKQRTFYNVFGQTRLSDHVLLLNADATAAFVANFKAFLCFSNFFPATSASAHAKLRGRKTVYAQMFSLVWKFANPVNQPGPCLNSALGLLLRGCCWLDFQWTMLAVGK